MSFVNVREAAEYLGLSASFLNKRRVYGGGPMYIKVGKRVMYDCGDLEAWIACQKVYNTSEAEGRLQ
jgi:predicted DNA-binding transcriptional regulator AlpA